MPASLCRAELLRIEGADAIAFAHAQFTSDVKALPAGTWQWSAWLDAQGRVRCFFALLHATPSCLLAWLPMGDAHAMRDGLARFVMRAAVKIEVLPGWHLHALAAGDVPAAIGAAHAIAAHAGGYALAMPGDPTRIAWLASHSGVADAPDALNRWRAHDIAAGLPLLAPELGSEFVPQALDLERIDAIRFDKGCYPGQEIAARLHFRGGNKRHLRRLRVDGSAPAPATAILDGSGANIGRILYSAVLPDNQVVALGVLARAKEDALDDLVSADGARIHADTEVFVSTP